MILLNVEQQMIKINVENLSMQLNYEIPQLHGDNKDKAEFNCEICITIDNEYFQHGILT